MMPKSADRVAGGSGRKGYLLTKKGETENWVGWGGIFFLFFLVGRLSAVLDGMSGALTFSEGGGVWVVVVLRRRVGKGGGGGGGFVSGYMGENGMGLRMGW